MLGADENPPTQANVSRLPRPKFSDWPPPIERPASARCSRSASVEYFDWMNGIRSESSSRSNAAYAWNSIAIAAPPRPPGVAPPVRPPARPSPSGGGSPGRACPPPAAAASAAAPRAPRPRPPKSDVSGSFEERPCGITTIIGTAFLSAIRLSRMAAAAPGPDQCVSLPPIPCSR